MDEMLPMLRDIGAIGGGGGAGLLLLWLLRERAADRTSAKISEGKIENLEKRVDKLESKQDVLENNIAQKLDTLSQSVARMEGRLEERLK